MACLYKAVYLSFRDWRHERILSLCAVLALASMLTPILILAGVKVGYVEYSRNALRKDPDILLIMAGAGTYTKAQVELFRSRPDVRYAIVRTRPITASALSFPNPNPNDPKASIEVGLYATSSGDPVLDRYGLPAPSAGAVPEIILSNSAASKLNVHPGQILSTSLDRKPRGSNSLQSVPMTVKVAGVLPPEGWPNDAGFVALQLLEDIQNYHDFIAIPRRGWEGDDVPNHVQTYDSFRLYARDIDDVGNIEAFLKAQNIVVSTKAADIARVRLIDDSLRTIVAVVAMAVGTGFVAFTASTAIAVVRRKDRMLGMLRLFGFSRGALLVYPMTQILLTSILGMALACAFFLGCAALLNVAFTKELMGAPVCTLPPEYFLASLCSVILLSLLASVKPSLRAANIEPSLVIRDI